MIGYEIDPARVRDISPLVLNERGRLRVLPAEFWATTTPPERALFGHTQGIYSFPTTELVEYLRELIGGRTAIEIGAGHGILADALDIPGTDNLMQKRAKYRRTYEAMGQSVVPYGRSVIGIDANSAVRRYRPDVVIGCWVTHRYDPRRHWAGGNEIGVDEAGIVSRAQYVFVGNDHVHAAKEIWSLPHTKEYPAFVYSRAANGTPDFIASWG